MAMSVCAGLAFLAVLLGLLLISNHDRTNERTLVENASADPKRVTVPVFQIQITLSKDAAQKLSESGEWIAGNVTFEGDGSNNTDRIYLGTYEFERNGAGDILVTNASISQDASDRLTNSDYYFTVNVFSARHVFTNNILDGGYAVGRISEAAKSPIRLDCTLLQAP
jgi:hypothetical protein